MSNLFNTKCNPVENPYNAMKKIEGEKTTGFSQGFVACVKQRGNIVHLTAAAAFGALVHLAAFFLKSITLPAIALAHMLNSKEWKQKLPEAGDLPQHLLKTAAMLLAVGLGLVGILTPAQWTIKAMDAIKLDPKSNIDEKQAEAEKKRREEKTKIEDAIKSLTTVEEPLVTETDKVIGALQANPQLSLSELKKLKQDLLVAKQKADKALIDIQGKWDQNKKPADVASAEEKAKKVVESAKAAIRKIEDLEVPAYEKAIDDQASKVSPAQTAALDAATLAQKDDTSAADAATAVTTASEKEEEIKSVVSEISAHITAVKAISAAAEKDADALKSIDASTYSDTQNEIVARVNTFTTSLSKIEPKLATANDALAQVSPEVAKARAAADAKQAAEQKAQRIAELETRLPKIEEEIAAAWKPIVAAHPTPTPRKRSTPAYAVQDTTDFWNTVWTQVSQLIELEFEMTSNELELEEKKSSSKDSSSPGADSDSDSVSSALVTAKKDAEQRKNNLIAAHTAYEEASSKHDSLPEEFDLFTKEDVEVKICQHTMAKYKFEVSHWIVEAGDRLAGAVKYEDTSKTVITLATTEKNKLKAQEDHFQKGLAEAEKEKNKAEEGFAKTQKEAAEKAEKERLAAEKAEEEGEAIALLDAEIEEIEERIHDECLAAVNSYLDSRGALPDITAIATLFESHATMLKKLLVDKPKLVDSEVAVYEPDEEVMGMVQRFKLNHAEYLSLVKQAQALPKDSIEGPQLQMQMMQFMSSVLDQLAQTMQIFSGMEKVKGGGKILVITDDETDSPFKEFLRRKAEFEAYVAKLAPKGSDTDDAGPVPPLDEDERKTPPVNPERVTPPEPENEKPDPTPKPKDEADPAKPADDAAAAAAAAAAAKDEGRLSPPLGSLFDEEHSESRKPVESGAAPAPAPAAPETPKAAPEPATPKAAPAPAPAASAPADTPMPEAIPASPEEPSTPKSEPPKAPPAATPAAASTSTPVPPKGVVKPAEPVAKMAGVAMAAAAASKLKTGDESKVESSDSSKARTSPADDPNTAYAVARQALEDKKRALASISKWKRAEIAAAEQAVNAALIEAYNAREKYIHANRGKISAAIDLSAVDVALAEELIRKAAAEKAAAAAAPAPAPAPAATPAASAPAPAPAPASPAAAMAASSSATSDAGTPASGKKPKKGSKPS